MRKRRWGFIGFALAIVVLTGSMALQWHRTSLLLHRIYIGATVLTMDTRMPVAQAVVTSGDRIVYVGDAAGALRQRRWYSTIIDLSGKTMMPGFIDAHSHFLATGLSTVLVDLHASPLGSVDTLAALYP